MFWLSYTSRRTTATWKVLGKGSSIVRNQSCLICQGHRVGSRSKSNLPKSVVALLEQLFQKSVHACVSTPACSGAQTCPGGCSTYRKRSGAQTVPPFYAGDLLRRMFHGGTVPPLPEPRPCCSGECSTYMKGSWFQLRPAQKDVPPK